MARARPLI